MKSALKTALETGTGDNVVIALDGPAGSGKSTVAGMLAGQLNMIHADSGAIYRTLTYAAMQQSGAFESPQEFGNHYQSETDPQSLPVEVRVVDGVQTSFVGGIQVSSEIRTPEVTARIKYIADDTRCRDVVNNLLREFARQVSLVVDGRDMGTVVFPDTPYKFFLEASVDVRADRRLQEFKEKGINLNPESVKKDIAERDMNDRSRKVGALKQADDAILIDTSMLDPDGVVSLILSHLQVHF